MMMKEIKQILSCREFSCCDDEQKVTTVCASDLMSEVLLLADAKSLIITNLVTLQAIRTAEMVESAGILFVRAKKPNRDMIELAKKNEIPVFSTDLSMFEVCGLLYKEGLLNSGWKNDGN